MFEHICKELGKEADEFLALLDDWSVPATALETALVARGLDISDSSIIAWRRKRVGPKPRTAR